MQGKYDLYVMVNSVYTDINSETTTFVAVLLTQNQT